MDRQHTDVSCIFFAVKVPSVRGWLLTGSTSGFNYVQSLTVVLRNPTRCDAG